MNIATPAARATDPASSHATSLRAARADLEALGLIERSREPRPCTVGRRPAHTWTAKGTLL